MNAELDCSVCESLRRDSLVITQLWRYVTSPSMDPGSLLSGFRTGLNIALREAENETFHQKIACSAFYSVHHSGVKAGRVVSLCGHVSTGLGCVIVGMKEGTSLSYSIAVSGPVSLRSLRANGGGRGHSQRGCGPAARPTDCGLSYQGCPSAFSSELWDQITSSAVVIFLPPKPVSQQGMADWRPEVRKGQGGKLSHFPYCSCLSCPMVYMQLIYSQKREREEKKEKRWLIEAGMPVKFCNFSALSDGEREGGSGVEVVGGG
ncbi:unnamed protein product [Leuciscus chuanchicus]